MKTDNMNFNNKINTTINYSKYGYYDEYDFIKINHRKLSSQDYAYYDKKAGRKITNSKKMYNKLFKKYFYNKLN